jgi:hypothetical protein
VTVNELSARRAAPVDVTAADGPDGQRVGVVRFDP